jgi:hypothetical protein
MEGSLMGATIAGSLQIGDFGGRGGDWSGRVCGFVGLVGGDLI